VSRTSRPEHADAGLLGVPGSRGRLSTPALVLDLDALERNVAKMAAHCRSARIGLRPHTKTHKSAAIARLQIEAGAAGVCCAKTSEAEALAAGGIDDILVTSPVVAPRAIDRLVALAKQVSRLSVVADSERGVALLARAAMDVGVTIDALVDVDVGTMRTGVANAERAVALARTIAAQPRLRFRGLQGYAGHVMHIAGHENRAGAARDALDALARARDAVLAAGFAIPVLTGGGTGTFDIDPAHGALTELQAGSYVFMDREYEEIGFAGGTPPFERSLFVHTTVISANHAGLCTTDAGFKAFATDGPKPGVHSGAPSGSAYVFMGDEHGAVIFGSQDDSLEVGALVVCTPPHCDPTVNLYDVYHCVRGDTLVDLWPVDARGCGI